MKYQALFSSKDKSKKLKYRLLQFLYGALRVKVGTGIVTVHTGEKPYSYRRQASIGYNMHTCGKPKTYMSHKGCHKYAKYEGIVVHKAGFLSCKNAYYKLGI